LQHLALPVVAICQLWLNTITSLNLIFHCLYYQDD